MANKTRIAAWLLALLTVGSLVTACGDSSPDNSKDSGKQTDAISGDTTGTQTADTVDTTDITETDKRLLVTDGLEDVDFNERVFRMAIDEDYIEGYFVEQETGDPCNDIVYKRNELIKNRFNIDIANFTDLGSDDIIELIEGGENFADVMTYGANRMYKFISRKLLYNWHDVEIMNLDSVYYNQYANESCTVNGVLYTLASDLSISTLTYSYGAFFNPRLVENYGIDKQGLYDMVNAGTWTIDKFIEFTKNIYEDLNQNNTADEEDLYGYPMRVSANGSSVVWLPSFGHKFIIHNDDGTVTPNFMSDLTVAALDKLREFQDTPGVLPTNETAYEIESFANGHFVFATLPLYACFDVLRDMEEPYSVLPLPKWNEEQDAYYTAAHYDHSLLSLPISVPQEDLEFIGTIIEALSCESYRTVFPTYFDSALKGRYSKEPQTRQMMDYIEAGRTFDLSQYLSDGCFQGMFTAFGDLLGDDKPISSTWTIMERTINKRLPQMYEWYTPNY